MRTSAVRLLKVKPLPASAFPALRLPPSASTKQATSVTSSSNVPKASTADVAAELEKKVVARQDLGENVRISKNISNKDLYWKVSFRSQVSQKGCTRESTLFSVQTILTTFETYCTSLWNTDLETAARYTQEALARGMSFSLHSDHTALYLYRQFNIDSTAASAHTNRGNRQELRRDGSKARGHARSE